MKPANHTIFIVFGLALAAIFIVWFLKRRSLQPGAASQYGTGGTEATTDKTGRFAVPTDKTERFPELIDKAERFPELTDKASRF